MPVTGKRDPPSAVARMHQWNKWIESENRLNVYQAATERQQMGYQKLLKGVQMGYQTHGGVQQKPSLPKISGSDLTRLLQPGLDHEREGAPASPSGSSQQSRPLASSASYQSLTSGSVISFPGLGGRVSSKSNLDWTPITKNASLEYTRSSKMLKLLESGKGLTPSEKVDLLYPNIFGASALYSAAPLRPVLRNTLEQRATHEDPMRWKNGRWVRNTSSLTPRSEAVATCR